MYKVALRAAAACIGLAVMPFAAESAPASHSVPDFVAPGFGWDMFNENATNYNNPPSGPKPVTFDPKYPHVGNLQPGQKTDRVADLTSPILKDWVKPSMQKANEAVSRGRTPFVATSLCWPGGVPAQLLVPTIVYFIQKPDVVYMIWERDHLVRRVYLNQKHTANPTRSFFGESVGHYEGDTLVVDTIGLNAKSYVDIYRTPHSEQLHVIERFRLIEDGKTLEAEIYVEDPGAFTTPWRGIQRFALSERSPLVESACAENNANYFNYDMDPMPVANRPDF